MLSSDQAVNFVVDGLTLQNGAAADLLNGSGGGLFTSTSGGALTLTNNILTNNTAINGGGGVHVSWPTTTVTLTNNILTNNTALHGGGIDVDAATVTLTNNILTNNTGSGAMGGGIDVDAATVTLTNNILTNNTGSGARVFFGNAVTLTNNTITGNTGEGGGIRVYLGSNDAHADIYNNIVWNNGAVDLYLNNDGNRDFIASPVNLFHNDFDHSTVFMQLPFPIDPSNLNNVDPLFVDAANGNYHLQVGSPVIDMGDNEAPALPLTDHDGNPRIQDGVVDMGAFEFPGAVDLPGIGVEPAAHDFGDVQVGETSPPQPFTITSTGTADLVLGTITLTGTDAAAFQLQNDTCSQMTLPPTASCTLEVVFAPPSVGAKTATLNIPDNAPNTPVVALNGQGLAPLCDGLPATIIGTAGDDMLVGTPGNDVIVGLGGNDMIRGLGGNDVICGGDGDDVILGGDGDDRLFGDAGNDLLLGEGGNNAVFDGNELLGDVNQDGRLTPGDALCVFQRFLGLPSCLD